MPGGSFSDRLTACWRLKVLLSAALATLFCVPYFLIGNFPIFPVHELLLSSIDRAIGFHPFGWVWIYQSVYLLINLIPWLASDRVELSRYTRGFVIVSLVSFACFVVYPIRAPKPVMANATGMYWLLQLYDVPLNSLPSLHAGLLVYTVCFARRIFVREGEAPAEPRLSDSKDAARQEPRPPGARLFLAALIIWSALILYATLATKEHYLVDIVAGTVLALFADAWSWRDYAVPAASRKIFNRSESTVAGRR